jgi:hypothetical protein
MNHDVAGLIPIDSDASVSQKLREKMFGDHTSAYSS